MLATKAWARDTAVAEIIKGATSPASLSSASALAQSAVADFFKTLLGPASAAAAVLERAASRCSFDSYASILVPSVVSDAANAGFVGEGLPLPVRKHIDQRPAARTAQARRALHVLKRDPRAQRPPISR